MKMKKAVVMILTLVMLAVFIPARPVQATSGFDSRPTFAASAGGGFAVQANGRLYGWLVDWLGDGISHIGRPRVEVDNRVFILDNVVSVSMGCFSHSPRMALLANGSLYGWGLNDGTVGDGTTIERLMPVRIMDNVAAVSAGFMHTLAITTDGHLYAWGHNSSGELGDGTTTARHAPVFIMDNVVTIAAGHHQSMAVTSDGRLYAWGFAGPEQRLTTPTFMMDDVSTVATNSDSGIGANMAVTNAGRLYTWGNNSVGQLGIGTFDEDWRVWHDTPTFVMDNVAMVSAVSTHSKAITTDGNLYGWGRSNLIDGTEGNNVTQPIRIMDNVTYICTGTGNSLILRGNGDLYRIFTGGSYPNTHLVNERIITGVMLPTSIPRPIAETVTLTLTARPGGTVEGGGTFSIGDRAAARAIPYSGYGFYGWFEDSWFVNPEPLHRNSEYSFVITADRTLEARFYHLDNGDNGNITINEERHTPSADPTNGCPLIVCILLGIIILLLIIIIIILLAKKKKKDKEEEQKKKNSN